MRSCTVPFDRLVDLWEERLEARSADETVEHVAHCATCRASMAWIEDYLPLLRRALHGAPDAPSLAFLHAARQIPREETAFVLADGLAVCIARPLFEERSTVAAGARGQSDAIHAAYSDGARIIEIWQEPAGGGRWHVLGQVTDRSTGAALTPASVILLDPNGNETAAELQGPQMHLPPVSAGVYSLYLDFRDDGLRVPEVVVGV
jgi:hypothetical protein